MQTSGVHRLDHAALALALGCYLDVAGLRRRGLGRLRAVSWAGCAAATFAVLFAAVQFLLPAYNEQFALRQPLAQVGEGTGERLTVVCYPQRFESVSFYRPDADVQVFGKAQRDQMLRRLAERPGALLVVKAGAVDDLVRELPESVHFVRCGGGAVQVGWVRPHCPGPDGGERGGGGGLIRIIPDLFSREPPASAGDDTSPSGSPEARG